MMSRRDELIKSGMITPKQKACTLKQAHSLLGSAFTHALGLAVSNDGRSRIYVCQYCSLFHVATDKEFEANMNQKVKELQNELAQAWASRDKWKADFRKCRKESEIKFEGSGFIGFLNAQLWRFGFAVVRRTKPVQMPDSWGKSTN